MKILVLQLARIGDIYMTWPVLRAIKRAYPMAEIHVLTRPRFESALEGLEAVDVRKCLPTERILESLVDEANGLDPSIQRLTHFLDDLQAENYQWVLNLSFSPFSSYLTHYLSGPNKKVTGYTRHNDGYFTIADEVSSYFYAQVGVDRPNRIHLTDLFATMAGIDLIPEDWAAPQIEKSNFNLPEKYIVVHIGASEEKKALAPFMWARIIKYFSQKVADCSVVLVGAGNEAHLGKAVLGGIPTLSIINLVGSTKVPDLMSIIGNAALVVGCDSAPMHIASLTNTRCLNLSSSTVNFWETGPRATGSQVHYSTDLAEVNAEEVATAMAHMIAGQPNPTTIKYTGQFPCYQAPGDTQASRFSWDLIRAIYLGERFPVSDNLQFIEAVANLHEMNQVVIENLTNLPVVGLRSLGAMLDRSDEVFRAIAQIVPEAGVYVRWLETERAKIPPGKTDSIYTATLQIHRDFGSLLRAYVLEDQPMQEA